MTSISLTPVQHTLALPEISHNTFCPYSENHVPIKHKLEAWCPTADLIALVNPNNQLELYRLSWRLHWSVSVKAPTPASQITQPSNYALLDRAGSLQQQRAGVGPPAEVVSLAWRPDGTNTCILSSRIGNNTQAQTLVVTAVSLIYIGKAIAVGLANGGVNIYDYRDGSVISSILSAGSGAIHCLKWTDTYLGTHNHNSILGTNVCRTDRMWMRV